MVAVSTSRSINIMGRTMQFMVGLITWKTSALTAKYIETSALTDRWYAKPDQASSFSDEFELAQNGDVIFYTKKTIV